MPGKKLSIAFNWHGDIGLHLAYELYHPPGNERAIAESQSGITFTDIAYLLGMGELHARTTANFTVEGELGGVSFRGLAHLDSKIGMDDPTLGFTHNHNLAAALDLGFLNDTIALHMGANVPIYPSTFEPALANPIGTVGLKLLPTDEFSLAGSAYFLGDLILILGVAAVATFPYDAPGLVLAVPLAVLTRLLGLPRSRRVECSVPWSSIGSVTVDDRRFEILAEESSCEPLAIVQAQFGEGDRLAAALRDRLGDRVQLLREPTDPAGDVRPDDAERAERVAATLVTDGLAIVDETTAVWSLP